MARTAALLEQPREREDEAGRAVAALERALLFEGLLDPGPDRVLVGPFDREHLELRGSRA